jgi:hypothetical protein
VKGDVIDRKRRCWDEDALCAVSIALYLYLIFDAVQAFAQVGGGLPH